MAYHLIVDSSRDGYGFFLDRCFELESSESRSIHLSLGTDNTSHSLVVQNVKLYVTTNNGQMFFDVVVKDLYRANIHDLARIETVMNNIEHHAAYKLHTFYAKSSDFIHGFGINSAFDQYTKAFVPFDSVLKRLETALKIGA
jgi:hypothetical protein